MDFDSLVVADWPRGLDLAKKLSSQGHKIAYLEVSPYFKNPFPLFLKSSGKKAFLESLGFLSLLEQGFCLLSPEGVWLFKEILQQEKNSGGGRPKGLKFRSPVLNKSSLREKLFAYLGRNLAGHVFEHNDSCFNEDELPLFSDCFLFEPSVRKKKEFEKNHPAVQFFKISLEELQSLAFVKKSFTSKEEKILSQIKKHLDLTAKNIFCFSDRVFRLTLPIEPVFQWKAVVFLADLGGYEEAVPEHFLGIKQLLFPWCYDNLMSVFQKKGVLEVWMRLPLDKDWVEFAKKAQAHLESFFPGGRFQLKNQSPAGGFYVYGKEILKLPPSAFAYNKERI